jgi:uncharacterized protein
MLVISDTSALSVLAETSMLHLLPAFAGTVTITVTIRRECLDAGAPAPLRSWMLNPPAWLHIWPDPQTLLPETLVLDAGEATAITLAWQERPDSRLILDEKRGRAIAAALGLPRIGVLALVTEAAARQMVDFESAVLKMKSAGFWLSDQLVEQARSKLTRR